MYMIFSFSGQTGTESGSLSHEISYQIVSVADKILNKNLTENEKQIYTDRIEHPVRKLAHMTEYCILALCVSFPLYVYGVRGFLLFLLAGLFCVGFACTDEFHQSFVAGRGPSKKDVLIDSTGALIGILAVQIFCHGFLRSKKSQIKAKGTSCKLLRQSLSIIFKIYFLHIKQIRMCSRIN
mgnify:CR=1 FL=1